MLDQNKIKRIKELSQKKKTGTLTEAEADERKQLHQEYIKSFRKSMSSQIEGIKVVDQKGEDITPERVKEIQKEKGLHDRDVEE